MQDPPSEPWREEYPSQEPPSEPWLAPLDIPQYHLPVSPYRPTSGQVSDLSGSLLVPPPLSGAHRPRRNYSLPLVLSISGGVVVIVGLVVALGFIFFNQTDLPAINAPATLTPTTYTCPPTATTTPAAAFVGRLPLVATHTPFPTYTPYPTYTPFPTYTVGPGGPPQCP